MEVGEDVVVHTDPVRIPFSALPQAIIPRPTGSRFATTFVVGTIAAPWIAGALITGHPLARAFALGWGLMLGVAFFSDVRQSRVTRR